MRAERDPIAAIGPTLFMQYYGLTTDRAAEPTAPDNRLSILLALISYSTTRT